MVTFDFAAPVALGQACLLMTFGNGNWSAEAAGTVTDLERRGGSYRVLFAQSSTVDGRWAVEDLPPATLSALRVTVRRTTGDDYVHLNELELWSPCAITALRVQSDQTEMYPTWRKQLRLAAAAGALPVVPDAVEAQWSVREPKVASVDEHGLLTALSPGTAQVTAVLGELRAEWSVPVRRPVLPPEVGPPREALATAPLDGYKDGYVPGTVLAEVGAEASTTRAPIGNLR